MSLPLPRAPVGLVGLARRVGWGLGDQAVSSLSNFVAAAAAAHLLSTRELGAYSLAFLTYGMALNCSRGLATDPLVVRFSGADEHSFRQAARACTGAALLVGSGLAVLVVLLAQVMPGPVRGAFLALGLVTPLLLLQDAWRFVFFAQGRGDRSFVNDLAWAVGIVPTIALVALHETRTAFWFVLAWGGAAGLGALLGLRQARVLPRPGLAPAWFVVHRDIGPRFMAEGMVGNLTGHARAWALGLAVGLATVGQLQVLTTLLGPLMIVLLGMGAVAVPELNKLLRRSVRWMVWGCAAISLTLVTATLLWGLTLWFAGPHGLGALIVGEKWQSVQQHVPLACFSMIGAGLSAGAGTGLRTLAAARRSLRAMVFGSCALMLLSVVGAVSHGLPGALLGTGVAGLLAASVWWWHLRQAVREHRASPDRWIADHGTPEPAPARPTS